MLRIRPVQMAAFRQVTDAVFENEVIEYLLEQHADLKVRLPQDDYVLANIPAGTLREIVRGGIARARNQGLTWKSNLLAFVVMMFVAAPNFDEHPLILHAMRQGEGTPDERFDKIWDSTTEENWAAASQHYDSSAWG